MKKSFLLLIVVTFVVAGRLSAQESATPGLAKNAVYVELFGSAGMLYNVSYDRILFHKSRNRISAAIGLQFIPAEDKHNVYSCSPQINYLWGEKHFLEAGIGLGYQFENTIKDEDPIIGLIPRIGYRFQKNDKGLFAKIAFTPIIILHDSGILRDAKIPWGGIAIGYSF